MELKVNTEEMNEVGDGLLVTKVGDHLIIVANTTNDIGPSKSGKMDGVASSEGFATLYKGIRGNIYIGKPV